MGTRLHKALILVLVAVLFSGLVTENACADRGPKPQITLTVINYPQGEYYVALLTNMNIFYNAGKATYHMDGVVDDKSVGEYLNSFEDGGYKYNHVNGRCQKGSGSGPFDFHYRAPENYRVIIIEPDGTVTVSEAHHRQHFYAFSTLDFATGGITETGHDKKGNDKVFRNMFINLLLTVIIELVVLLLFRYPFSGRNVAEVIFLNIITNIRLQFVLLISNGYIKSLIIWEVIIFVIEGLVYGFSLRDKDGKKHFRKGVLYALVANLLSALSMLIPNL